MDLYEVVWQLDSRHTTGRNTTPFYATSFQGATTDAKVAVRLIDGVADDIEIFRIQRVPPGE